MPIKFKIVGDSSTPFEKIKNIGAKIMNASSQEATAIRYVITVFILAEVISVVTGWKVGMFHVLV